MSTQFHLMRERRFLPFFLTQFFGAFNDNVYKNALVVMLTFQAARYTTLAPGILVNLCAGLFILPFFLFSATAGQLADKYEKSRLMRLIKFAEIPIMGLTALAFRLESLPLLLATLFLMGAQSSIFGPVKYAILPQHLREHELVGGNALVESGTFVSILLGTLAGGLLAGLANGPVWVSTVVLLIAACGYLSARGIPVAGAADPQLKVNWNPLSETWRNLAFTRENRTVFLATLGISWFWLYGALFLSQFPGYAKDVLGGNEATVTLLLAVFSVGIGVGSLLCERLSGKHVEIALVPFGAFGLTLFGLALWLASPVAHVGDPAPLATLLGQASTWGVLAMLLALGAFGGFFIVPLYALIQARSAPAHRARVIAGNNILNALFMVVGALGAAALLAAGLSIPSLFALAAILNGVVALYIFTLVPEFLLRFLAWLLVHSLYRLETRDLHHLPEEGPAILLCNHQSRADALILLAATSRPLRFLVRAEALRNPLSRWLWARSGAIFVADPASTREAVARALAAGERIALFPEGAPTADGRPGPESPELLALVADQAAPSVRLALSGMWGSLFSARPAGLPGSRLGQRVTLQALACTR